MIQSVNHLKIEFYLYPFTRFNHLNLLRHINLLVDRNTKLFIEDSPVVRSLDWKCFLSCNATVFLRKTSAGCRLLSGIPLRYVQ
jgi:hypothetical protein